MYRHNGCKSNFRHKYWLVLILMTIMVYFLMVSFFLTHFSPLKRVCNVHRHCIEKVKTKENKRK